MRISQSFLPDEFTRNFCKAVTVDGCHPVQRPHALVVDSSGQARQDFPGPVRQVRAGNRDGKILREISAVVIKYGQGIPGQFPVSGIGVNNVDGPIDDGLVGQTVINTRGLTGQVVSPLQTGPAVFPIEEFQGEGQNQFRVGRQLRYP